MASLTQCFQPWIIIWAYPMAEIWKSYSLLPSEIQVSDVLQRNIATASAIRHYIRLLYS